MASSQHEGAAALGVGIIGLGGAAIGMISKFARNSHYKIAAAADIDAEILERFHQDHPAAETYSSAEDLCGSPSVDLVYIATPNRFHSEHAQMALEGKKHVLIEKPMTITLEDADAMIDLAERSGVLLGVNVKHSFEPRVLKVRDMAKTGELGQLRMMHSWRYQDWLYRPRTPEELTPEWGGGILWRQGPHQFDILRTMGGGLVKNLRGMAQTWDPARHVPGAHVAFLDFEDGAVATAVYSGYDHFETRELVYGTGPEGQTIDPAVYAQARRELRSHGDSVEWETEAARSERYGGDRMRESTPSPVQQSGGWILGGPLVVSFDKGDVRLSPGGLLVYGDEKQWEIPLVTRGVDGRDGRLQTYYEAIAHDRPLPADGRWGKATLEVLLAVEESGRERREMELSHQAALVDWHTRWWEELA